MKLIQLIPLPNGEYIFLTGFDLDNSELTFRTSRIPEMLQTESIKADDKGMLHTSLYNFNGQYLQKFINENEIS